MAINFIIIIIIIIIYLLFCFIPLPWLRFITILVFYSEHKVSYMKTNPELGIIFVGIALPLRENILGKEQL